MAQPFGILKRSLSTTSALNAIKNVTVIGGGLMGAGIAQVAAQTGHDVTLVEMNPEMLKKAEDKITVSLARVARKQFADKRADGEKFINFTKARITGVTDAKEGVKDADLVIEAIVENIAIKHLLFRSIDDAAPDKTIFASNTSSLGIGEIASVTHRKDKFGGLHFFNPVPVMKLLEVARTPDTSDATYNAMMEFGKAMGKICITCKDTPGFVVNRLLIPYLIEAIQMYERGDASAKDIDTAMKFGAGYPMGPIELADYVGHDTTCSIIEGWHKKFPENPIFKPCESMKKLVGEGKLGMKSGQGYYKYDKK